MSAGKKHLIVDAENVLRKTRESRSREFELSNSIFDQWLYWSAIFLGELDIPDDRIHYFQIAYMESCREVQSSIVLAFHGSYKNAVQILRNWLELTVAGIYYDHDQTEGQNWQRKGHHLKFKTFKRRLERDRLLSAETFQEISEAWEKLSAYVHSLGPILEGTRAETGYGAVFAEYNQKYFDEWFGFLTEIYSLCCILLIEHIPEVLGSKEINYLLPKDKLESLKDRVTNR